MKKFLRRYKHGKNCEPTYEELKLWKFLKPCSECLRLRAYLWGIETHFVLEDHIKEFNCEPTYEELKQTHAFFIISFIHSGLRAYLWGIETIVFYPVKYSFYLIASLPMRNWNYQKILWYISELIYCEPTYEELKRCITTKYHTISTDCEPTYEELKLLPL